MNQSHVLLAHWRLWLRVAAGLVVALFEVAHQSVQVRVAVERTVLWFQPDDREPLFPVFDSGQRVVEHYKFEDHVLLGASSKLKCLKNTIQHSVRLNQARRLAIHKHRVLNQRHSWLQRLLRLFDQLSNLLLRLLRDIYCVKVLWCRVEAVRKYSRDFVLRAAAECLEKTGGSQDF